MTLTEADSKLSRLAAALGLDEPEQIVRTLTGVYEEVEREVRGRAQGLDLPCHAGCDACCREAVFVSAPEFFLVARELLFSKTHDELRDIQREMLDLAEKLEDELELLEQLPKGAERDEVAARVKFSCPLLSDDGLCTVYSVRELNARTFGASWDTAKGEPYGCELTHQRLVVLGSSSGPGLYDARAARALLKDAFGRQSARVHVYPWWFKGYGAFLL